MYSTKAEEIKLIDTQITVLEMTALELNEVLEKIAKTITILQTKKHLLQTSQT